MHHGPDLLIPELPAFDMADWAGVEAVFEGRESLALRQSWLEKPEAGFRSGTVRLGWRGETFHCLAVLEDDDVFTRADGDNQWLWERGDVFELFLGAADRTDYLELHVAPNAHRLQLRFPEPPEAGGPARVLEDHVIPAPIFRARVDVTPGRWSIHAAVPASEVEGRDVPSLAGLRWRISFGRYDYRRDREAPVISSTSPHPEPKFHRAQEWQFGRFAEGAHS